MATEVENDWWYSVGKLAQAHTNVLTKMVHAILHKDVKLSKKLVSW
jgi:hypothetical protein